MTEQVATRKPRKALQADALLAAACHIVGRAGLAGLTLRPLAESLGVSVTVLTNRYGARADVVAAICDAACERDTVVFTGWRTMLSTLGTLPPSVAADLVETILEEQATRERALSTLYLEMLHACGWDASLRPAFAAWAQQRRAFWTEIADRSALAPALIDCGWWHGYVIAELAYSMALNQVTPYRMLRRLCLQRLFAGGVAMAADAVQGKLFSLLLDQMLYGGGGSGGEAGAAAAQAAGDEAAAAEGLAAGVRAGRAADWPAQAARACGIQLAAQGIDGLSHRAIAAQIGIPHTTLSYRFPTQHDLVIAGLEAIAAHILSAVDAGSLTVLQRMLAEGDGPKLDLARANFAVAIATMRMPELTAYTANMRSRRGNNLVKVFKQTMPGARGLDALCAQIVSMGLTGLTNTQPPGQACDAAVASAFSAVASWLGQQQQSQ